PAPAGEEALLEHPTKATLNATKITLARIVTSPVDLCSQKSASVSFHHQGVATRRSQLAPEMLFGFRENWRCQMMKQFGAVIAGFTLIACATSGQSSSANAFP